MSEVSTRERLLEAGCDVFAEHGYRNTTVAEICKRAHANIAAVNYHFGDKSSLYTACWHAAFDTTMQTFPLDEGVDATSTPEERLRAFVRSFVRRVFDENKAGRFPRMMVKEMAEPTDALEPIIREVITPQRAVLHAIVADLLDTDPDDPRVASCAFSVISQCVFFAFNRVFRSMSLSMHGPAEGITERLATHISRFCLVGIANLKEDDA